MRKNTPPLVILYAFVVLLICGGSAHAQNVYIVVSSSITFDANTKRVNGVSQTSMDYRTTAYYIARTKGYIYTQNPGTPITSSDVQGGVGQSVVSTQTQAATSPYTTYNLKTEHYLLPPCGISNCWYRNDYFNYYYSSPWTWWMPSEFGGNQTIYGCNPYPYQTCYPNLVYDWIWMGNTNASVRSPIVINITNYKVTNSQGTRYILNGTTQNALLAAEVFLETQVDPGSQGGGVYSWICEGNPTITGGSNQSSIHFRWKQTGTYRVTVNYTKDGSVSTSNFLVNVIVPTLNSFSANAEPEQVSRDMRCSTTDGLSDYYAAVSMGCYRGTQFPLSGIVFHAEAQIPTVIYLTEPGEAGIKIKQYVRTFRKRVNDLEKNGTFECDGHRDSSGNLVIAWQVDGQEDISPFLGYPPKFYSNTISRTAVDGPGSYLDGTRANGTVFMHDASFTEESFETYVDYFVGADPYDPLFTVPLKLTSETTYKYSKISWSRNLQTVFDPSVPILKYRLQWSNSTVGNVPVTGTNVLPQFQGNGTSLTNQVLPCVGGPASSNKIDGARCFVKQLYWDFLNRAPDQAGWDYWLGQITQCAFDASCIGWYRTQVAKAFFLSGEFIQTDPNMANPPGSPGFNPAVYNRAFVRHCYVNFLRREPDQGGWDYWTWVLNQDGDYNHTITAFIVSGEYRDRADFHACP